MKYILSLIATCILCSSYAQQDGLSTEPIQEMEWENVQQYLDSMRILYPDSVIEIKVTLAEPPPLSPQEIPTYPDTLRNGKPKPKSLHERKYVTTDEIGGIFGFAGLSKDRYFFSYHSSNVWQINRYFYIGPGFGFEIGGKNSIKFDNGNKQDASIMMPLFMELRIVPGEKRIMPMISQKQGYTFYFAGKKPGVVGGAMSQTQIGFKLMMNKWASFNMSAGYRLQYLAIPAQFANQFGDLEPMPTDVKPAPLRKVYHYATIHIGFTY